MAAEDKAALSQQTSGDSRGEINSRVFWLMFVCL